MDGGASDCHLQMEDRRETGGAAEKEQPFEHGFSRGVSGMFGATRTQA